MTTQRSTQTIQLQRSDPHELLTHMAAYGLAAIVESEVTIPPALSWSKGMAPRPCLSHPNLAAIDMAQIVKSHAARQAAPGGWLQQRIPLANKQRGLMSPRLSRIEDWRRFQGLRHKVLDGLSAPDAWLDQLMVWSLGEPSYWLRNAKGETLQDGAASRFELQPRNQGSEIVGNRLSPLADKVSKRAPQEILDALVGASCNDTVGNNKPDSRSAVGFRGPGPVDDTVSWCALWGISQFAINRSSNSTPTSATVRRTEGEYYFLPIWQDRWTPAHLRTLLASRHLREIASKLVEAKNADQQGPLALGEELRWLLARGVKAMVVFPVRQFGSDKAPERRAQRGIVHPLGDTPR